MTTREKTIAICVGAAIGLFALDSFFLTPYLDRLSKADELIAQHNQDLQDASAIVRKRSSAAREWRAVAGESVKTDYSSAESQLQSRVRECAQRASLYLPSQKTDKAEKEKGYERVTVSASGNGTMAQIGRFLFEIQQSDIPVRVTDLEINSRKDGVDDLGINVKLTTIYQPPAPAKVALAGRRSEAF